METTITPVHLAKAEWDENESNWLWIYKKKKILIWHLYFLHNFPKYDKQLPLSGFWQHERAGLCQDSAFEGVLLEFNMQFEISLKLFVHIHSFFVSDKTAHKSTVAAVTDIVISTNYCIPISHRERVSRNKLIDSQDRLIIVIAYIQESIFKNCYDPWRLLKCMKINENPIVDVI